jgi:hypothetical protein
MEVHLGPCQPHLWGVNITTTINIRYCIWGDIFDNFFIILFIILILFIIIIIVIIIKPYR